MKAPSATSSLADWLDYQERVHPRGIELGLERVGRVARRLGLPDASIPTLVVAGTNGKGSSATLAALVLREAGYRTGLYTSPHLLRYNERVALDGREAADAELVRAFGAIEAVRGDIPLTYFEYGTLAALWLFREAGVQAQVLEVGLGGRLDAVNLVDADVALITSIGLDHLDWLGPDREHIGFEKAQVYRAGRPAICAEPDPPASLLRHAAASGARLQRIGHEFAYECHDDGRWTWRAAGQRLQALPPPGLRGEAQLRNAAGTIAALRALQLRLPVPEHAIRAALPRLALRGRFERIGRAVYDVAHNAEAAAMLAEGLRAAFGARRVELVLGMFADKPVEAFCRALAPQVRRAYCATLPPPRGLPQETLAARVRAAGIEAQGYDDVAQAIEAARAAAGKEGGVLVTGSFLTVAAGLAHG